MLASPLLLLLRPPPPLPAAAAAASPCPASATSRCSFCTWRRLSLGRPPPFAPALASPPLLIPHHSLPSSPLSFMSIPSSPHPSPPPGYRPNVGLCLLNSRSQVFIAKRLDLPDSWQMPQGGVDNDEEPKVAALRELKEETGVTSVELIGEVAEWLTYDFPPDVKEKITQLWGREWKGQAQKWFLFKFVGEESEIKLDGDEKERAEFSDWKWASIEEVLERAVDFKRPVYEKVFKSFETILS